MNPKRPPDPPMTLANISERSASPTTPNSIAAAETVSASLSLETYLNPAAFPCDEPTISALRQQLGAGRLIVIRDAFVASFAEQIHGSLDACTAWQIHEAYQKDFHYRHHNLYEKSDYPPDLTWCEEIFRSSVTKTLAQRLSGRECAGPTLFSASWYLPGDHSLPHTDASELTFRARGGSGDATIDHKINIANELFTKAKFKRQVAFVWHLAKHWQSEWGGALFWCPKSVYLPPVFNTLVLFNVGPDSYHFVTEVSPYAQGKRLAVNGWWTGRTPTGADVRTEPEQLGGSAKSIEIY